MPPTSRPKPSALARGKLEVWPKLFPRAEGWRQASDASPIALGYTLASSPSGFTSMVCSSGVALLER